MSSIYVVPEQVKAFKSLLRFIRTHIFAYKPSLTPSLSQNDDYNMSVEMVDSFTYIEHLLYGLKQHFPLVAY